MNAREWGDLSRDERDALAARLSAFAVLVDRTGSFTYVGRGAAGILGDSPTDPPTGSVTDSLHEADVPRVESLLAPADGSSTAPDPHDDGETGPLSTVEARVTAGDGEWRWVEFATAGGWSTATDESLFLIRDVTDDRRTVEWFRHLVEAASDLLVVLDANGVFTYLTPAASRVLGYEPAELRGEQALDYIHPGDRELVTTELQRGLTEPGHTATVEHRFRGAEGAWRWLESRGRSLDETATGTGRIVVVTRDVTERRRREERIAAQNDRLDTFAGVVSHDLQGPLAVASGNLELYRKTGDEAALDRIERAHQRMSRLTSTLLALARDGDGEVSDFEPVSLVDCATTALETSPLAAERVSIDEGLPTVRGDYTRLCSVFENLFRNVATHAGPDAQVWAEPLPDEPGFLVADDGPGLPAADTEREALFEAGRSGTDDGTGFGLYIVDAVVTAHGWTVTATDRPGGGAQFEFRGLSPIR